MFRIRGYLPRITVRTVARVLKYHGGRVADIACGRGVLLKEISTHNNKDVVGIDIDTDQIEYARSAGMTVVLGDIFSMPFKDEIYDIAVCLNTLYNFNSMNDLVSILSEMVRIVRKGGKVVLDIRNKRNLLLYMKYWLHMKRGKHPTVSYLPTEIENVMKGLGCNIVMCEAVGINNQYLALDFVLIFEKE